MINNESYENKKFLPLGSVVLLKDGKHKLMIVGYCSSADVNSKKMFDYMGCFFPEGIVSMEKLFVFNHTDIKTLYSLGFNNEDFQKYNIHLHNFVNSYVDSNGLLKYTPEEIVKIFGKEEK